MSNFKITKELIQKAKDKNACSDAIEWLEKKERTWLELKTYSSRWAAWGMAYLKDIPIDLTGLASWYRADIMINRLDCPIDLKDLCKEDQARVMADRPDCPIDLDGLNSNDRAYVIEKRGLKNE